MSPDAARLIQELAGLKSRGFAFVEELATARAKARTLVAEGKNLATEVAHAEGEIKDQEAFVMALVSGETEKDKPRWTNDTARKAEVKRRLPEQPIWVEAVAKLESLQRRQRIGQMALATAEDEVKNLEARDRAHAQAVTMTIAEVAIHTGGLRLS